MTDYIKGSIWGLIVGDALGVPVEFKSREHLKENPVTDMMEYGTHCQPKGTWSDDSSMMLCTLDSLCEGEIDYDDIMAKFASWLFEGEYTPYGETFDFGGATYSAINRYRSGVAPLDCGGRNERDNGNGSLMRILPVVLYRFERGSTNDTELIEKASALTHAHPVSTAGCALYAQYMDAIMRFKRGNVEQENVTDALNAIVWNECDGIEKYSRLRDLHAFAALPEEEIKSGGYVVSTLEAAMWCFLNTDSFADCVLKAVNLGSDTDTTAAVAGAIAGAYYGTEGIPAEWLDCMARKEWIAELIEKFEAALQINAHQ